MHLPHPFTDLISSSNVYTQEEMFTRRWMSVNHNMDYAEYVMTSNMFLILGLFDLRTDCDGYEALIDLT